MHERKKSTSRPTHCLSCGSPLRFVCNGEWCAFCAEFMRKAFDPDDAATWRDAGGTLRPEYYQYVFGKSKEQIDRELPGLIEHWESIDQSKQVARHTF